MGQSRHLARMTICGQTLGFIAWLSPLLYHRLCHWFYLCHLRPLGPGQPSINERLNNERLTSLLLNQYSRCLGSKSVSFVGKFTTWVRILTLHPKTPTFLHPIEVSEKFIYSFNFLFKTPNPLLTGRSLNILGCNVLGLILFSKTCGPIVSTGLLSLGLSLYQAINVVIMFWMYPAKSWANTSALLKGPNQLFHTAL